MISFSPGHWAKGSGASGLIDEVTEARKVSKRVVDILKSSKLKVNYIEDNTSKNQKENLNYLVSQHNKTDRKLDVSIHFNASGEITTKGIGTEVLYYTEKDLAIKLSRAISQASGLIDRGAKQRTDLAILKGTNKPAILIEICFVNSTTDVAIYRRDFEKICQSIANILIVHLGKSIVQPEQKKERETMELLTETGRIEIREMLRKARDREIIGSVHTDQKINNYSDRELLSYQAAVLNRTFK